MGALVNWSLGALVPYAWPLGWSCLLLIAFIVGFAARLRAGMLQTARPLSGLALALLISMVGAAWSWLAIEDYRQNRFSTTVDSAGLVGVIRGLPTRYEDSIEFLFEPLAWQKTDLQDSQVRVRWYRDPPDVLAGEAWQLELQLKSPVGLVNFAGSDSERWYFRGGIAALATVRSGQRLGWHDDVTARVDRLRDRIRREIHHVLSGHDGVGLVLALAVADRDAIEPGLRRALTVTGTGHLLAISGLHVGLVAGFGWLLFRLLAGLWPARWVRFPVVMAALLMGLAAAAGYAMLAGWGTSTRRALVMLVAWALFALARRRPSPWFPWWLALAVVLAMDPRSPADAGFWMSFGAVAVLLMVFSTRQPRIRGFPALVLAQTAIGVVMLPLGLALFGFAGAGGWVANLLAIPWVSLVNLPLVLAGVGAWLVYAPGAEILLYMAADAASLLAQGLDGLASFAEQVGGEWRRPAWLSLLLALAGGSLLLCARGVPDRWAGVMLVAPLFLPAGRGLSTGEQSIELLDVGQGLSALVRTRDHLLVYDTGPGVPDQWDRYRQVLAPTLRARAGEPEVLLVSHGDLDHAGALDTFRHHHGGTHVIGNFETGSRTQVSTCHDERYWDWDGVHFDVLHPGRWLPYLGNDSSCVLSISGAGGRMLLPGDISHYVERRLSNRTGGGYRLAVAPHHGSRHSSSTTFIDWARPEVLLVAAGQGNRFGFPHPEFIRRAEQAGAVVYSTSDCGALRARLDDSGRLELESARVKRPAAWRWRNGEPCP